MAEPMSERDPQSTEIKQQKEQILSELRRQNEAVGGKAMIFMKNRAGGDVVLFLHQSTTEDSRGGFLDGLVLFRPTLATMLINNYDNAMILEDGIEQEAVRHYDLGKEIQPVNDEVSEGKWESSLNESVRAAVAEVKKEAADKYFLPKALRFVKSVPDSVRRVYGFDMESSPQPTETLRSTPTPTPTETVTH